MSVKNFDPVIWSAHVQRSLRADHTLVKGCNRAVEGELQHGARLKILTFGAPTVKKYTGGVIADPEEIKDAAVYLDIDQGEYVHAFVENVDEALANKKHDIMAAVMDEIKEKLLLTHESFVGKLATKAKNKMAAVTVSSEDDAVNALLSATLALRKMNVPQGTKIYADVPWSFYQKIWLKTVKLDTDNTERMENGVTGRFNDVLLRPTNNLYNDGTNDYIMVRTKNAIAFAEAVKTMKAYEPEKAFSDAIKALTVFGGNIIRQNEIVVLPVKAA